MSIESYKRSIESEKREIEGYKNKSPLFVRIFRVSVNKKVEKQIATNLELVAQLVVTKKP